MPGATETFTAPDGTPLLSHVGELGGWTYWEAAPPYDPPINGGKLDLGDPPVFVTQPHMYCGAVLDLLADWEVWCEFDDSVSCDGIRIERDPYTPGVLIQRQGSAFGPWPGGYNIAIAGLKPDFDGSGSANCLASTLICRLGFCNQGGIIKVFTEPIGGGARTYLEMFWYNGTTHTWDSLGFGYPIGPITVPGKVALFLDPITPHTLDNLHVQPYFTPPPTPADPAQSTLAPGGGFPWDGTAGVGSTAVITAKDSGGAPTGHGGDTVVGTIIDGPNVGTPTTIIDHGDGTYGLAYTPLVAGGTDTIAVTLDPSGGGHPAAISGSPFTSDIHAGALAGFALVVPDVVVVDGAAVITVRAVDAEGNTVTSFDGQLDLTGVDGAELRAQGGAGVWRPVPDGAWTARSAGSGATVRTAAFVAGVATLTVSLLLLASGARLAFQEVGGALNGFSNTFDVVPAWVSA